MLMGMDEASLDVRLAANSKDDTSDFSYRNIVQRAKRPEEVRSLEETIDWAKINTHLGTNAKSITELVHQLGIMRFGRTPIVADAFSGSGQIPFEAARLGCTAIASDLNPIACMLTWGAYNLVGGGKATRARYMQECSRLVESVRSQLDQLGVEKDGEGWQAKTFLYCVEVRCPQTGWMVPLLPTQVISKSKRCVVRLKPDFKEKRYHIELVEGVSQDEIKALDKGNIRTQRGQPTYFIHAPNGQEYRTNIGTLRGDVRLQGKQSNKLRKWLSSEFQPAQGDVFQERLYAVQWMRRKPGKASLEYQFRGVTDGDLEREQIVHDFVASNFKDWQSNGLLPNTSIEPGAKTSEPIRTRGWTAWHHLFNPRQLMVLALMRKELTALTAFPFGRCLNLLSRLCRWDRAKGSDKVQGVFDNQALNTLYNYGCRSFEYVSSYYSDVYKSDDLGTGQTVLNSGVDTIEYQSDLFITDLRTVTP